MANSKPRKIWQCSSVADHIFDEPTADGWCPAPRPPEYKGNYQFHGVLLEIDPPTVVDKVKISIIIPKNDESFNVGDYFTTSTEIIVPSDDEISKVEFFLDDKVVGEDVSSPYEFRYYATKKGEFLISAKVWTKQGKMAESAKVKIKIVNSPVAEIGLSVILMDASDSMCEVAYKGSPITKMRLVATTAASGIFELDRMQNNPNAYVAAYKFDTRIEPMFLDTIANLIRKYDGDVGKFADDIYNHLDAFRQGTDINQALMTAHSFLDEFLQGKSPAFSSKKYRVMMQTILKYNTSESVSIPNVRVLIYTDGKQYDAHKGRILRPNPFVEYPLKGLGHDIVIGAFFGLSTDEGCEELKELLSRCPIHDELQFFLFDNPSKIGNLKYLFKMASGASGFCPKCLEKEMYNNT